MVTSQGTDNEILDEETLVVPRLTESFDTIDNAQVNQNEPFSPDMLLALQLSFAEYEDDDVLSAFATHYSHTGVEVHSDDSFAALRTDLPPSYEQDFALSQAVAESKRPDTAGPWRATPPRDRYDVAGIATYRLDPRRRYRPLSKPQTSHLESSWFPFDPFVSKANHPNDGSHLSTFIEKTSKGIFPISDPVAGAPLINVLDADCLLYLVDFLCFPDVFALTLTCKPIHALINLKFKKKQYYHALTAHFVANDKGWTTRTLCEVCLYVLPRSYYRTYQSSNISTFTGASTPNTCTDCFEFRARVELEIQGGPEDNTETSLPKAAPVWRPSKRVFVDGGDATLWYRERE